MKYFIQNFRTLCNYNIFRLLIHSKPFLSIFRTQNIRDSVSLQNTVYTVFCVSLTYSQPLYIQALAY